MTLSARTGTIARSAEARVVSGPMVASVVAVGVTAALVTVGRHQLGPVIGFLPAVVSVVACFDVLSVYLLVGDHRDTGDPRSLAMAAAYAWSLVLMAGYALALAAPADRHHPGPPAAGHLVDRTGRGHRSRSGGRGCAGRVCPPSAGDHPRPRPHQDDSADRSGGAAPGRSRPGRRLVRNPPRERSAVVDDGRGPGLPVRPGPHLLVPVPVQRRLVHRARPDHGGRRHRPVHDAGAVPHPGSPRRVPRRLRRPDRPGPVVDHRLRRSANGGERGLGVRGDRRHGRRDAEHPCEPGR